MSPVHTTESAPLESALEMGTGKSAQSDPGQEPAGRTALVLVLNHHRDPLDELVDRLRRSGYDVIEAGSLAETHELLETSPTVVVLNPLVLTHGSIELEILQGLQAGSGPVPVILLVESIGHLQQARPIALPLCDFVQKPVSVDECVHRVEIAIQTRARFLALEQRARELEGQVSLDFKTNLLSELYFRQIFAIEFKRARRHQMPLSMLLIDVDDFKAVNDTTEYAFGDEVLRFVARCLKHNIRETDFAARFGGDEFVVLLPQTTPAEAVATAIRIRKKILLGTVQTSRYSKQVTISVGIDTHDGRTESTPEEFKRRVNVALQEAKRRGKNQVWLYSEEGGSADVEPTQESAEESPQE